ncbi:hypothetical protein JCM3770_002547, partial [Rhodotorula araucariae]
MLDEVLLRDVEALEAALQEAVRNDSQSALELVADQCVEVFGRAAYSLQEGRLDNVMAKKIVQVAFCVRTFSSSLLELGDICREAEGDFAIASRRLCDHPNFWTDSAPPTDTREDDPAVFAPYRRWFIEHLANPYPSPKDKEALLKQVERHNKTQLDTWFVNIRRRSGWQA